MADHVNISDPSRDEDHWRHRRELEALRAELKIAYAERDHYAANLSAIFNRIERGERAELHYRSGDVIVIAAIPDPEAA